MKFLFLLLLASCSQEIIYEVRFKTDGGEWQTFKSRPIKVTARETCQVRSDDIKKLISVGHQELTIDYETCYEN